MESAPPDSVPEICRKGSMKSGAGIFFVSFFQFEGEFSDFDGFQLVYISVHASIDSPCFSNDAVRQIFYDGIVFYISVSWRNVIAVF